MAAGLDYSATDVSEATFRDVFLPPFAAGVEAGALTLMSAFIAVVGGVPAAGSRWLQTDVLRGELNFTGFVVSDYEADLELIDHGFAANESDAAQKALWAGVDMSMQSGIYRKHLPTLVKEGKVAMNVLDEAARRVLNSKARMGLLDDPYRSLDLEREAADHWMPEHDALALKSAQDSIVMLKNVGGALPLRKSGQKVALIGWWVEDKLNAQGVGVAWGNATACTTLAEGVTAAMADPASDLRTVVGSEVETGTAAGTAEATAAAAWADVVVLALGEPTNYSGEAQSRTDIVVPAAQQQLAEAVAAAAHGKPVIVMLKNGRALALEGAVRDAEAILVTCEPPSGLHSSKGANDIRCDRVPRQEDGRRHRGRALWHRQPLRPSARQLPDPLGPAALPLQPHVERPTVRRRRPTLHGWPGLQELLARDPERGTLPVRPRPHLRRGPLRQAELRTRRRVRPARVGRLRAHQRGGHQQWYR